jgi:hypothetical protein
VGVGAAIGSCPYCGEQVELYVDGGGGRRQRYVEDCAVCCRPIEIAVEVGDDDELIAVRTATDSDMASRLGRSMLIAVSAPSPLRSRPQFPARFAFKPRGTVAAGR